ncbi:Choline-sulfatase [Posidoniimonas polymericola]|uniref:Choline-sulfatase n=1 Tax=Posidoniimonas polymericola TaxID=2528002 RepID=A0A5C5XVR8_9BACT|nr:sulfatase [Posidoniimonas polymericola]TWT66788.1 Choline-sulfatase [Posidoniimonas polymericola]
MRLLVRLTVVLLAGLNASAAVADEKPTRPNIVVFITDDQSRLDCTAYGSTDVRTPNMAKLAQQGMTFDRAFVASPSCAPSRAALLTGLMPARNGAEPNHSRPRKEIKKRPAYFQELGYEVVAFGKVAHYNQAKLYGFDQEAAGKFQSKGNMEAARKYLDEYTGDKPVCLLFGTHQPHGPWPANKGYDPDAIGLRPTHVDTEKTRKMRSRYYTSVTEADRRLGVIYELVQAKLGPETMFVFTSDHGAQWPFGKWNLYDEGTRVPMIVSWPGRVEANTRTDAMVSWIDLLPTLLELAGGEPPAAPTQIDGRSFAGVLTGEQDTHRDEIFTTHSGDGNHNVFPIRAVRDRRWKYILNLHPEFVYESHVINAARQRGDRGYWQSWVDAAEHDKHARWVVDHYQHRVAEELYDLEEDPHEQENLAADPDQSQRVREMRQRLEEWMAEQGDQQKVYGEPKLRQEPAQG